MQFVHRFDFEDVAGENLHGKLSLDEAAGAASGVCYRIGRVALQSGAGFELCLTSSPSTSAFIYIDEHQPSEELRQLLDIPSEIKSIQLPGQLVLGAVRTRLVVDGVRDQLAAPPVAALMQNCGPEEAAVFSVLREGVKYGIGEALQEHYGLLCDEIVTDARHIADSSVEAYHRRVLITIFRDEDMTEKQRRRVTTAFIGDSVASGTVLIGVIERVRERFPAVRRIEVIAPLATLRGLARIAAVLPEELALRAHLFETVLNALPPDYYFSAHFTDPNFHIRPDLHERYTAWWGKDPSGTAVAETACAGYGWSEAFFTPRRQIDMIDEELHRRHGLALAELISRNAGKSE